MSLFERNPWIPLWRRPLSRRKVQADAGRLEPHRPGYRRHYRRGVVRTDGRRRREHAGSAVTLSFILRCYRLLLCGSLLCRIRLDDPHRGAVPIPMPIPPWVSLWPGSSVGPWYWNISCAATVSISWSEYLNKLLGERFPSNGVTPRLKVC